MKILQANGASIPALGLGTWKLKGETCSRIVSEALQSGYDHIDTAIMYDNERDVGEGVRASGRQRDDLFITTKVWPTEVTVDAFHRAVEGSLERLGMDYVDLLLIHWPPKDGTGYDVWAGLLDDAVKRGWTKHIGVSNFTTPMLDGMAAALDNKLVCNQVENHPYLDQRIVRAACEKHGIALIAYCPLYRGEPLAGDDVLVSIADRFGKSPAQVVLRWHIQNGGGAIPKTATPARLKENLAIFDFELSDEDMAAISALCVRNDRICDFEFSPVWDAA